MRKLGQLTEWNDDRGYGFISPENGGPRVFVHIKTLQSAGRRPQAGEWLRFVEGRDPRVGQERIRSAS